MKRSKTEILNKVSEVLGDRNDDAAISLYEDISDSFDDDGEDWKNKYDELDASWRARYIERFKNIGEEKDTSEVIETEQPTSATDTAVVDEGEGNISLEDIDL